MGYRNNIKLKLSDLDMEIVSQMPQRAIRQFSELAPVRQRQMIEKAKKKASKTRAKKKSIDCDKQKKNAELQEKKKEGTAVPTVYNDDLQRKNPGEAPAEPDSGTSENREVHSELKENRTPEHKMSGSDTSIVSTTAQNLEKLMEEEYRNEDIRKRKKKESQEAQTLDTIQSAGKKSAGGISSGIAGSARKAMEATGESGGTLIIPMFIGLAVMLLIFLICVIVIIIAVIGGVSGSDTYRANTSEAVEAYRSVVEKYCEQYGMEEFEEIILAIMMQESGGNGTDPMQASECGYNTKYPHVPNGITDPEYSIECGIQNFKDCTEKAGCNSAECSDELYLALQGYNFGQGYILWALTNYGKYSTDNAKTYSMMMAAKLGWASYGDTEYVQHVLRYYVQVGGFDITDVSNEDAVKVLTELKKYNDVDEERWSVICMGASRIGKTKYDMYGEDTRAGTDDPRTLDCSSFVAWSFHKAGFSDVPYYSTTDTFLTADNFEKISADELEPGDIGLNKGETGNTGGGNHVGIYVGKNKNGSPLWMHCTSGTSSNDMTKVNDGPRISYYTNFTVFYRYKGFRN